MRLMRFLALLGQLDLTPSRGAATQGVQEGSRCRQALVPLRLRHLLGHSLASCLLPVHPLLCLLASPLLR